MNKYNFLDYRGLTLFIEKLYKKFITKSSFLNLLDDEKPNYLVIKNIDKFTLNNDKDTIRQGDSFVTQISPFTEIGEVRVNMGGIDITDIVHQYGTISIDSVTGNLEIIAKPIIRDEVYTISKDLDGYI